MHLMSLVYTCSASDNIYKRQQNNNNQEMYQMIHNSVMKTENYLLGWTKDFPEEHNTL